MKRRPNSRMGENNWLNTYADMITLLLTFFILLYSCSTMDAAKWKEIVSAFNKDFNVSELADSTEINLPTGPELENQDFDSLYYALKKHIEENDLTSSVEIYKGEDYHFIVFKNQIFFDGDSSVLKQAGKQILDFLCDGIRQVSSSIGEIRILGHTAQALPGRENDPAFDRTLSTERANSVLLYIQGKDLIDPGKIVSLGYGQHRPLNDNSTEALRQENRRVEILIRRTGESDELLNKIYEEIGAEKQVQP